MAIKTLFWSICSIALVLVANGCDKTNPPTSITLESEHFTLITTTELSTSDENTAILYKAEVMYDRILEIVGEDHRPQNKITIRPEGNFIEKGPYFDNLGIHLYRYSPAEDGYLGAIAHELVHAFHEEYYIQHDPYQWTNYPYIDEGVAEYISQLVDTTSTWFPWYGYYEHAVIGDLVLSDNTIPHQTLREQHLEFNQPCHIQSYTQRSSWMRYIDETYGRTALLQLSYTQEDPTLEFQATLLGEAITTIDTNWATWVIANYNNTPNASAIASAFRERTSWYTYCE